MEQLFSSIIPSYGLTAASFFICTAASLVLGGLIALAHDKASRSSAGFSVTLALIPVISQTVIMMVNGSLGAGVAVAGAFSLIRFRSIPGTAREICSIFLAMTVGVAAGMGYIGVAVSLTVITIAAGMLFGLAADKKRGGNEKSLKITIPEDLDYEGVFDPILDKYASSKELVRVRTVHMGSLFKLEYRIELKDRASEKSLIDELRCRNGNLEIVCGRPEQERDEM